MTRNIARLAGQNRARSEKAVRRAKGRANHRREMPMKSISANSLTERKVCPSYEGLVAYQLSSIPGIDAVFVYADDDGLVHVYSVVPEFSFGLYKRLLNRERRIENEFAEVRFEFHVRAHQGRKAARAVPLGARPVFVR
jgi:hypothetical protein